MKSNIKISHFALYTCDLERMRDFFSHYFGATANEMYHNPHTGLKSYFLSFGGSVKLEIMTRPELSNRKETTLQTGYTHLALSVGSKMEVDRLTANLAADGYKVVSGPRTTGDGFYESCILGPENHLIEITE